MITAGEWAFTGRDEELAYGVSCLEAPDSGGVVISGAPGLGKSRLADELSAALAERWTVRKVAASPNASAVPFGAFAHLLDHVDHRSPQLEPTDLLHTNRRLRAALLDGAQAGSGLVLIVDDAHALDDASAALVLQLVLACDLRTVVTVRSGEPCADAVHALWRDELCRHVELQPLARHEIGLLASSVLGRWLDHDSLDRIFAASEGNPLFLRELLADASASGGLVEHRGLVRWRGVVGSARLTSLVARDLERTGDDAVDIIDLVAIGEPLPVDVASRLATPEVLGRLEAEGVLRVDEAGDGLLRLAHPLFGEVRRSALGPLRRRQLLARLVRAYDQVDAGPLDRVRVARWCLEIGEELAGDVLLDAATIARRHGDNEGAELLVRRAIELGPMGEADLLLAELAEASGRPAEAADLLMGLVHRLGDDQHRARALEATLRVLTLGFYAPQQAEAALLAGLETIEDATCRSLVEAQWATLEAMSGRLDLADALGSRLARHPDDRVRLRSLTAVHLVAYSRGELDQSRNYVTSMIGPALQHQAEFPDGTAAVFSALALDLLALGDLDGVDGLLALVDDPSSRSPSGRGYLLLVEGSVALRRGRIAVARRAFADAARSYDAGDPQGWGPSALALGAQAAALAGDGAGSRSLRSECLDRLGRRRRLVDRDTRRAIAWASVAAGDPSAARREWRELAADARALGLSLFEMEALHDAARADAGARLVGRLHTVAAQVEGPRARAIEAHARGLQTGRGGDLEAAAEAFEALGELLTAAEVFASAARRHRSAGVEAGARRAAHRANMLVEQCEGAAWSPPEEAPSSLTPRERQIASLVAGGASSAAVAERLEISRRTVDNQLSRVYAKLGIAGRADLPRALGLAPDRT